MRSIIKLVFATAILCNISSLVHAKKGEISFDMATCLQGVYKLQEINKLNPNLMRKIVSQPDGEKMVDAFTEYFPLLLPKYDELSQSDQIEVAKHIKNYLRNVPKYARDEKTSLGITGGEYLYLGLQAAQKECEYAMIKHKWR